MTSVEEYDVVLNGETVSSKTLVGTLHYSFDGEGKQFRKKYVDAGGNEQKYVFEYQDEKNIAVQLPTGIVSHSKSDHLGRKVFDELQLGSGLMNRKFTYHEGVISQNHLDNGKQVSDPQTTLVKQIEFADGRIIEYEYDAEERITRVIDTVDGTYEYVYDEQGQLLTEMRNGDTVSRMTYDDYGNIINKNGVAYTYGGGDNWKDQLTRYGSQTIGSYDGNGNPRSYLGKTLVWEKGRQLKSFGSNTYTYNKDGIRTSKTVNGVKHSYVLDGTNIVKETWGSNTLIPLYDLDNSVCGIKYNNTAYYFYKNLQGDVIAITDASGTVIARYVYDAWGRVLQVTDAHCNSVANDSAHIANINPFRYRGYYYDQETQLYYLQSRYYDPKVGRFINADKIIDFRNNAFCNQFSYCHNNPVNSVEIEGAFALTIFGVTFAGLQLLKLVAVVVVATVVATMLVSTPEFQRAWNDLCIDFVNGVEAIGSGLKQCADNVTSAVNAALEKAKIRARTSKTEKHHIVPKNHRRTKQAIRLMEDVGIDRNSELNLVDINYYLHKHLHTSLYLISVNYAIVKAYYSGTNKRTRRSNITRFLIEMKEMFLMLNNLLK